MRQTKLIYLIVLGSIVLSFLIASIGAHNERTKAEETWNKYQNTLSINKKSELPLVAIPNLKQLLAEDPENDLLMIQVGFGYLAMDDVYKAKQYFDMALKTNPYLFFKPSFTLQYSRVAFEIGNTELAKAFFIQSERLGIPEDSILLYMDLSSRFNNLQGVQKNEN